MFSVVKFNMFIHALYWLFLTQQLLASQNVFSVNDDVFAYPQYEIDFSSSYILEAEAESRIRESREHTEKRQHSLKDDEDLSDDGDYEQMILHGRKYLCSIPCIRSTANTTEEKPSREDQQKELIRAADRGWELLQDMEGKQCLYYSTGWWSYAFCYNSHVKQFHSLPSTAGGARVWPPQEDQTTPSYILGKYDPKPSKKDPTNPFLMQEVTQVQTRADGNYLVQRLSGGTPCDLTGRDRKIEIEFHCHPQTTDRIGWIKETTTCAYLMVVYTPRLCNDVAFQPTRESHAHTISCQEILSPSEAANLPTTESDAVSMDQPLEKPIMIGNIEVGGMKYLGKDGKKLERGRIVMTADEKAEIIAMQNNGLIESLSKAKLKELNLEPKDIEDFQRELQKVAGKRDWKIERLEDGNGQIQLRGIVSADGDDGEEHYEAMREGEGKKNAKKEEGRKDEL